MSVPTSSIPCSMDDLYAEDGRIDTLRKAGQTDFTLQMAAAEKKVWANLSNRQRPIWPEHIVDRAQLTPLKVYWTMHLIYQGGITSGNGPDRDRNAYLAQDFEERYNRELQNLHIEVPGGRVQVSRRVVRC